MFRILCALWLFISVSAQAEKAGLKLKDIPTDGDTSIIIKKGATTDQCIDYTILEGNEEITGNPEYDRGEAFSSWKSACAEWKASMKDLNKGNQILTLNCNAGKALKEDDRVTYVSSGTYKIKTKIRDKK